MITNPSVQQIWQNIHYIRENQVMLDSDLATLYALPVKRLNEQVQRNRARFPVSFMFQLTKEEFEPLRSQIATSNMICNRLKLQDLMSVPSENMPLRSQFATSNSKRGGRRHLPYAFTEQGVAMVSAILNTEEAIRISILIMETFVRVRKEKNTRILIEGAEAQIQYLRSEFDQKLEAQTRVLLDAISQKTMAVVVERSEDQSVFQSFLTSIPCVTAQDIQKAVAKHYSMDVQDLSKETREKRISLPRQVAMYLMRETLALSFKEIGTCFGGMNHTTVLHGYQKIKSAVLINFKIRTDIEVIQKFLQGSKY
jgi:hypothetical protein